jgi:hypothetical protein
MDIDHDTKLPECCHILNEVVIELFNAVDGQLGVYNVETVTSTGEGNVELRQICQCQGLERWLDMF